MTKIGIIAGGGKLPIIIGESLIKSKFEIIFFCIKDHYDSKFYKNYEHETISITSLKLIIRKLKEKDIKKIIMVGKVTRPSIKDIKFDFSTLSLIKYLALESKGDNKLLNSISKLFHDKGFSIYDWKKKCQDIFVKEKYLTSTLPSKFAIKNLQKGLNSFKYIGRADIAQSLIVQNSIILGVEAAEGTDELIKRCLKYKKRGDKGILIKFTKYNQNKILDIPVIGLKTVKNLLKYNYEGIYLETNKCIIIDKEKVIKFCNSNSIFIATVDKN